MVAWLSSPFAKNFRLPIWPKSPAYSGRLILTRGVGHRHERWDGMRWTQQHQRAHKRADEWRCCVRQSRVVLTPRRWRQAPEMFSEVTVAKEPGRRGEHEVSRKTIAQGKPALLRFTCGPTPVLFYLHGAHGCDRHPVFPAPSAFMRGARVTQGSGTSCRGNAGAHPHRCLTIESGALARHCEERSDDLSAVARRAKAEAIHSAASRNMDCFASLAMTLKLGSPIGASHEAHLLQQRLVVS